MSGEKKNYSLLCMNYIHIDTELNTLHYNLVRVLFKREYLV